MTRPTPSAPAPDAPLAMPAQDLGAAMSPTRALPADPWGVQAARLFVFGSAAGLTAALGWVLHDWFRPGGLIWAEVGLLALSCLTAFWIALSVATAILGLLPRRAEPAGSGGGLDVAVLVTLYGGDPAPMARAMQRLMAQLARAPTPHRFALAILSDTHDPDIAAAEARAAARLQAALPGTPVHYRRRARNDRYKAGNIQDWVTRHGAAHDAMLVLDSDSVMEAEPVLRMADALAADPALGLVQSIPRLTGARTVFARTQAFANTVYGTTLARGLALWSGTAANYWGHNAMLRTRAFAAAAGLPDLPGRRPLGGVILSHDFVEAALLRRAGWRVRFLAHDGGSFEETPATPLAHILRDRRWCQGNIQHLRLIAARGLHPLSRVHMAQGAVAYLASVMWAGLIVLWLIVGRGQGDGPIRYFSAANPLFPAWPEMDVVGRLVILGLIYGMLIAPKILGAAAWWATDPRLESAGGPLRFLASLAVELLLSVLLAPMMMVQHTLAVGRTLLGRDTGWKPQARGTPDLATCLRFHRVELALGLGGLVALGAGVLTPWLSPVVVSLAAAPLLSWAAAAQPGWAQALFRTPQDRPARRAGARAPATV